VASTGPIESWNINPTDVGPIFPFTCSTVVMFAACAVFCVAFMVWKFATENSSYAARASQLQDSGELANSLSANDHNRL